MPRFLSLNTHLTVFFTALPKSIKAPFVGCSINRPEFAAQVVDVPPAQTKTRRSRRKRPTAARPQTAMLKELKTAVTKLQEEFTSFDGRLQQIEEMFGLVDAGDTGKMPENDDLADSEDDMDDDPADDMP